MPISSKILVKVGKTSNIKFRGVQAFRAITLDELDRLSKLNPDASIVIIENIEQNEDIQLKQFIKNFESTDEKRKVFFYVKDNDDATCGVADELAYDIYLNIKDLYRAIKQYFNITVDIDLTLSPEFNTSDSFDDSFDDSFSDAIENVQSNEAEKAILPSIENKDGLSDFDTSILNINEQQIEIVPIIKIDETSEAGNLATGGICDTQDKEVKELAERLEQSEQEINNLKVQLHDAYDKAKTLTELTKALETERDIFKDRLKLYNESTVLEEPISLIEYQELKNKLKQVSENQLNIDNNNEQISIIKTALQKAEEEKEETRSQLEDYKERLSESARRLSDSLNKITNSENIIDELSKLVDELKSKADNSEATSIELQSAQSNSIIAQQELDKVSSELKKAISSINELTDERSELLHRIELEVSARIFLMHSTFDTLKCASELTLSITDSEKTIETLRHNVGDLVNVDEYNKKEISELQVKLEAFKEAECLIANLQAEKSQLQQSSIEQLDTINELSTSISDYKTEIENYEQQLSDVEKRIELAHNFAKEELDTIKREAIEWKTKFEIVQSQYSAKDAQYNTLVQSVGMNENGVNSLLENNKTMDEINKTLRDQIVMLKGDLDKANKDKVFAQQTATSLEETNRNMRVSMKAMSVGMSGGVSSSSGVPPFQYQGRGMVIPVFGCGSFGITTTAMSIANKLAAQARVLYVDFDMVAPKADGWFKVNPLIRGIPDVEINSTKSTGMGLFVDKQIQYFLSNTNAIILKPIQTKSGCVDYISGFYAKPDAIKLMSADFASFLNYCGNTYTYVIIDFGRLGSSDVNDQIIKAFCDIAYRSVAITTSDKFEIRTFRMKMAEAKIDINNVAWLVNMCERTNLEDTAKKAISPALYSLMPFNIELYGKKLDFTKDRLTRDKLSLFMDKVLFRN